MGIYRSDFSSVTVKGDGGGGGGGGGGSGSEVKVSITARGSISQNDMVQILPSADAAKIVRSDCAAMRPGSNKLPNTSNENLTTFVTADKRIIGFDDNEEYKYYEYGVEGRILNTYDTDVRISPLVPLLNGSGFIAIGMYTDDNLYFLAHVGASPVQVQTQIDKAVIVPSAGNSFWLVGSGAVEYWSSSATLVFRENINQTVFYDCATLDDGSLVTGAFIVKQDKSITNYTSLSIGGVYYSGNADHFWAVSQDAKTIYTFSTAGTLINTFSVDFTSFGHIIPYNNDLIYVGYNSTGQHDESYYECDVYYHPADKTKSITKLDGTRSYDSITVDPVLGILYASDWYGHNAGPNVIAFDLAKLTTYSLILSGVPDGTTAITSISDGVLLYEVDSGTYIIKVIYTQFLGVSLGSVTAGASGYANAANGTYTVNSYYGPQTYNIPAPVNNSPISSGAGAKLLGTNCTVYSSTYKGTSS